MLKTSITILTISFCLSCKQSEQRNEFVTAPDYSQLEREFLKQVVVDDPRFDSLLIFDDTREIEFDRIDFITPGFDSIANPCVITPQGTVRVTEKEFILIYHQYLSNQCYRWNSEKLMGRNILTQKEYKKFINDNDVSTSEKSWTAFHKQIGKGDLKISKPIFFGDGQFALFSFRGSWDFCGGIDEFNIYRKVDGKWEKYRQVGGSIICRLYESKLRTLTLKCHSDSSTCS